MTLSPLFKVSLKCSLLVTCFKVLFLAVLSKLNYFSSVLNLSYNKFFFFKVMFEYIIYIIF
jgi:hypothetical protein